MSPTSNWTRCWSTTPTRFKLLRKIGTTGHNHELTTPGDFAKPTGLAVDHDGNLYVCDTLNNRIEIFDADGKFIEHLWQGRRWPGIFCAAQGRRDRWRRTHLGRRRHAGPGAGVQPGNQLLIHFGGHGLLPGQFQGLVGIAIDKNNRVFTSEIYPGRVQQFRYVTDAEAEQLRKEREEQREKKAGGNSLPFQQLRRRPKPKVRQASRWLVAWKPSSLRPKTTYLQSNVCVEMRQLLPSIAAFCNTFKVNS